jgi:hypothetical protein
MQNTSWTFYPIEPPPLQTWQIVFGAIVFLIAIAAIAWRLRRRPEKNPGSLNLDDR